MRCLFLLAAFSLAGEAERVRITLLATTDLHGNIYPYDYFTAKPAERGLAKIATLVRQERQRNPNTLLVDCGDTIQGAPIEGVYQQRVRTGQPAPAGDPMMLAMNRIGYDAMVVGNHEYNFGLKNLERARGDAKFPWLSANTLAAPGSIPPFAPYLLKTVAGVKIAIIGITTPGIPYWEKPENYLGLRFLSGADATRTVLAGLREQHKPDLVLVAAHAGLDRDLKTGAVRPGDTGFENMVWRIASQVNGVDAIVFGHSHQQLEQARIGDVLITQPKNWGISLARVDFELERDGGSWRVAAKTAKLLPVSARIEPDAEILALARPYHELAENYLTTPVAQSPEAMDGLLARIMDSPLMDAIHQVQLHYSKADVSLAAMFNPRVRFPKGPVTVREIAALYLYDNELYGIEGNGRMLREALENAARYFLTCPDAACSQGPLLNRNVIGFNFDMAQGVEYEMDLTRPEGQRIRNLRYRGKPLEDAQPLRIAVNSYRAGGSGGYTMFRDARVLWRSNEEIRNLIIEYYTEHKTLPAKADQNWRIVPEAARRVLEAEVRREAGRAANF
ncbi:MAG: 5'-nucleotidase C-terminal domain-containing protein [Acidobacteria bacterium]|nr:5'-nucleotidase C-terminal domain-containing protein [Acidobacteriota bacterium]